MWKKTTNKCIGNASNNKWLQVKESQINMQNAVAQRNHQTTKYAAESK